ncbi:MAG: CPBP family intramembrane metalloprotease [Muribaculaceae bacterium]|nr:CPBP family intramembrane metalloprotease [Muribaculaceae bacterium]
MKRSDLALTLSHRLILLFCIFLVCYVLAAAGMYVLGRLMPDRIVAVLRVSTVLQDVLTFILPALITALIVTRRPAQLLCLMTVPSLRSILLVAGLLLASIPLQEAIIYANAHITLPESMAGFEQMARMLEERAFETLKLLLADTSAPSTIINCLIIGVLAGFSEELLFRGCFQRLLTTAGVNPHLAIWLVAFCFSALHMQFFGFVPRMLLGAYFGYLLFWTRSIWVPMLAHVLNNLMFVLTASHQIRRDGIDSLSADPQLWSPVATIGSLALTALILWLLWRGRVRKAVPTLPQ